MSLVLKGYLFAAAAAASYGTGHVLIRQGLVEQTPPLVGLTVSMIMGVLGMLVITWRDVPGLFRTNRQGIFYFGFGGVLITVGVAGLYMALSTAPVIFVSPVVGISPLVTLLVAGIFLRQLERITPRLVAASVLVVAGVLCITAAAVFNL